MEVKVRIKDPILRSYLHGLFKQREDGSFLASIESCTGAVICTLATVTDRPVFCDNTTPDMVQFHLPQAHINSDLRGKHLRMPELAEQKINTVLHREFEVNFISYCNEAKAQGIRLKDAIAMFIADNGMDIFDGDLETMKKRYYRYELTAIKNMHEKLRQKAYYASQKNRQKLKLNVTL